MRILMSVLTLFALCFGAQAQETMRPCNKAFTFNHTVATMAVAVAGVEGKRIYYCGFTIMQRGPTLDMIVAIGKGADCSQSKISVTPQFELPADFALSSRVEQAPPVPGSEGASLCLQTVGPSGKLGGVIFYDQF